MLFTLRKEEPGRVVGERSGALWFGPVQPHGSGGYFYPATGQFIHISHLDPVFAMTYMDGRRVAMTCVLGDISP
jgi:hypothetical protein